MNEDKTIVTVCDHLSFLTHRLKDGYFISVIFREAHFAQLQFHFEKIYELLEREY